MKDKKYFLLNMIYFIAMISIAIIFVLGYAGILTNDVLTTILIQIVVMFAIPLLLYTLLVSKNFKTTLSDVGFKKISGKMILFSILIGFALYLLNSYVATFFQSLIVLLGYENISSSTTVSLNYSIIIKEFFFTAVLPGICEEVIHRGVMFNANSKNGNPRLVLITSSILFGLMHLNINQFFYAAILGYLMGYVVYITKSIYPSIIIHFMNNFLSIYFSYGYYLDLPFTKFYAFIQNILISNVFIYIVSSVLIVLLLISVYVILCKQMFIEKTKFDIRNTIKELKIFNLPVEQAQERLNALNKLLQEKEYFNIKIKVPSGKKFGFFSNTFLISSILLGIIVTISSFIWGIL